MISSLFASPLACGGEPSPSPPTSAAPSQAPADASGERSAAPSGTAASAAGSADVEPVYPRNAPTNGRAERLCRALHDLPTQRFGACCDAKPSAPFLAECTRTLSFAIDSGAVTLDDDALARCEAAQSAALEGCGWPHGSVPRPIDACTSVLVGTVPRGKSCRSALECAVGDTCVGLSATSPGVCGEPKEAKQICQTAVDTLASYTFAALEERHPECKGVCDKLRCRDATPVGEKCLTHVECGRGSRCEAGACKAAPAPVLGEPCSDTLACAGGLRCLEGSCNAGKPEGAACKSDRDCLGTCEAGSCKRACATPNVLDQRRR